MRSSRERFRSGSVWQWAEHTLAGALTLLVIGLHWRFLMSAGPLWRDEISSLRLATVGSLKEFWAMLIPDVFPPFYFAVLRGWTGLGFGTNDVGLRVLGFVIAICAIAALWITARIINKSAPVWPLSLLALNPVTLVSGDQLRPHGLGVLWIIVTFGLVWWLTFKPVQNWVTIVLAAGAALLSVQTVYTNALFVFSICVGSIIVLLRRKRTGAAAVIFSIGAAAGLSLLPYLVSFPQTHRWLALLPGAQTLGEVWGVLWAALSSGHPWVGYVWLGLAACLLVFVMLGIARGTSAESFEQADDRLIFAGLVLVSAILLSLGFFRLLHWQTFPRYFLLLMAVAALCFHVFAGVLGKSWLKIITLLAALVVAGIQVRAAYNITGVRLTDCDRAAAAVESESGDDDVIILTGFYYGLSFQRYYHGRTPWRAVPDIEDYTWYRWDLVMTAMMEPARIRDLLRRMEFTLRSGHKVFLVGSLVAPPATEPEPLPAAPHGGHGWELGWYIENWQEQVAYFLEQHAQHGKSLSLNLNQPVDPLEDVGVFVVSGWRDESR